MDPRERTTDEINADADAIPWREELLAAFAAVGPLPMVDAGDDEDEDE